VVSKRANNTKNAGIVSIGMTKMVFIEIHFYNIYICLYYYFLEET